MHDYVLSLGIPLAHQLNPYLNKCRFNEAKVIIVIIILPYIQNDVGNITNVQQNERMNEQLNGFNWHARNFMGMIHELAWVGMRSCLSIFPILKFHHFVSKN